MGEQSGDSVELDSMANRRNATRWIIVAAPVAAIGVLAVLRSLSGPATQEANGTFLSIDVVNRRASLEILDPANGATRAFDGVIPETCVITVDGTPAKLEDLRAGDIARVRVRIERKGSRSDRERRTIILADEVTVIRRGAGDSG